MFGLALAALSTLAEEAADSVGKWRVSQHKLNVYALGFLLNLGALLAIGAIGVLIPRDFFARGFPGGFVLTLASLPTLSVRVVLEMLQAYAMVRAMVAADRSTFGFLRTLTLPLLLAVDVLLGYPVTLMQTLGIATIVGSLLILFAHNGLRREGSLFVIIGVVNAVATISLYKYDITHFNSVEAEQGIVYGANVIFLFALALFAKQNPLPLLRQPVSVAQLLLSGAAATLMSFAYLFAHASAITAGKRSFAVLWSIASGNVYFKERRLPLKAFCFFLTSAGILLLVL